MKSNLKSLNRCRRGVILTVDSFRCCREERLQFYGMGLRPGCRIKILSTSGSGMTVIKTGDTSLMLDSNSGNSVLCIEE